MTNPELKWTDLSEDDVAARQVAEIAARASEHDKIDPLSEQFLLGLDDARLGHRHLLAWSGGVLAGAAAVAGEEAELVVDPQYRGAGIGTRIYGELAGGIEGVKVWAHGNVTAAQALARDQGLRVVRRLLVMEVTGDALSGSTDYEIPEGMSVANLSRSRELWDAASVEQAWLAVNNDAFSWHPEQGGWDLERLHRAMEAEWFSADDVWFIWDAPGPDGTGDAEDAEDTAPALAGFHWTKWHDERTAEVYVVGLSGTYRGRGLGGPVVSTGLAHLVNGGAQRVILYVEDDNEAAVKRYRQLGFTVAEEHVVYTK